VVVVIRRTGLPEVLQDPQFLFPRFHIGLRSNSGQLAELLEANVGTSPAAEDNGGVRVRILRPDTLKVCVHDAIHGAMKTLASLHSLVEQPAPARPFFALTVE
jgi:hypothetical protein